MERTRRLKVVKLIFGGAWFALLTYIFLVQVVFGRKYTRWAKTQHEAKIELLTERGLIYDQQSRPLVINSSCSSIYILPQYLTSKEKAAEILARHHLGGYSQILGEIRKNKRFFWFAKKLDYALGQSVEEDLKKAGLWNAVVVVEDTKRTYPWGELLGSVLGFLGDEQKGMAGIEYQLNDVLAGEPGWAIYQKDPLGNDYRYPSYPVVNPKPGATVYLTLDLDLQQIVFEGLKAVVDSVQAKKGMVVVLSPTGAVLALADYPDFDPNYYQRYAKEDWKCAAVSNEFEPGSSFKHIIAATCLESNPADTADTIDTRPGSLRIGGYTISDVHSYGRLSFSGVFEQSSNVGVSRLSFTVSPKSFYETARRLGFGSPTGIELPAEGSGLLDKPNNLNRLRLANNSFGQGVRCTAIQLAASYLAIANNGLYRKPFLVDKITDGTKIIYQTNSRPIRKALHDTTCFILKEILARAVAKGTGKNANLEAVPVCGKTGTAQKPIAGGYSSEKLNLSFVGFFPKDNPLLLIAIVIDEPAKPYYASEVACPLFKKIGEASLRLPQYSARSEPGVRNEPSARNGPTALKAKPGVQKTEPTTRNGPSVKKNLVQNAK
jgi:cell division protein FtsI/penicillin-binding protein 2